MAEQITHPVITIGQNVENDTLAILVLSKLKVVTDINRRLIGNQGRFKRLFDIKNILDKIF